MLESAFLGMFDNYYDGLRGGLHALYLGIGRIGDYLCATKEQTEQQLIAADLDIGKDVVALTADIVDRLLAEALALAEEFYPGPLSSIDEFTRSRAADPTVFDALPADLRKATVEWRSHLANLEGGVANYQRAMELLHETTGMTFEFSALHRKILTTIVPKTPRTDLANEQLRISMIRLSDAYEAFSMAARGVEDVLAIMAHVSNRHVQYQIDQYAQLAEDLRSLVVPLAWATPLHNAEFRVDRASATYVEVGIEQISERLRDIYAQSYACATLVEDYLNLIAQICSG